MAGLIRAEGVSKSFVLHHARAGSIKERVVDLVRGKSRADEEFLALDRVSFTIQESESVALVGRNGSGKSTLLKLLAGIYAPTGGRLLIRHGLRMATMIELGVGFHPDLTGRENVYLNASIHGLSRAQVDAIYPDVVAYAELDRFMDVPIKTYSSGMTMRLGFAIGVHLDPDVFLLDEIFAVGDEAFQRKCLVSMRRFRERGKTLFFVSHAAAAVREMCQRAIVLSGGRVSFDGETEAALQAYRRITAADVGATAAGGLPWHRRVAGGLWQEAGARHLAFLREQGLRPSHRVLDLGCGALRTGIVLLGFLDRDRYVGVDQDAALVDAGVAIEAADAEVDPSRGRFVVGDAADLTALEGTFDVIWANALIQDLSHEHAARTLAAGLTRLAPGGRMFVSYFEAPGPAHFDPIDRPGPTHSQFDRPPRHFDYASLARWVEACGGRAEPIGDWGDPHGQMMLVVSK